MPSNKGAKRKAGGAVTLPSNEPGEAVLDAEAGARVAAECNAAIKEFARGARWAHRSFSGQQEGCRVAARWLAPAISSEWGPGTDWQFLAGPRQRRRCRGWRRSSPSRPCRTASWHGCCTTRPRRWNRPRWPRPAGDGWSYCRRRSTARPPPASSAQHRSAVRAAGLLHLLAGCALAPACGAAQC